jgi:hypothetical protein
VNISPNLFWQNLGGKSQPSEEYLQRQRQRKQQQDDAQAQIVENAKANKSNWNGVTQGYGYGNFGSGHGQSGAFHAAAANAQNAKSLQGMIDQTMGTWGQEHANRTLQAREQQQRNHEANLQAMQSQAEMAKQNNAQQMFQQSLNAKRERNAALMSMAGLGGRSIRTNGRGGVNIFRNALLG